MTNRVVNIYVAIESHCSLILWLSLCLSVIVTADLPTADINQVDLSTRYQVINHHHGEVQLWFRMFNHTTRSANAITIILLIFYTMSLLSTYRLLSEHTSDEQDAYLIAILT